VLDHPRHLVNGQFQEHIAIGDRGLSYGDGVFETILLVDSQPVLFQQHLARLKRGCETLKIPVVFDTLGQQIQRMLDLAEPGRSILKVIVTRGAGGRGYQPIDGNDPNVIISLLPAPDIDPEMYRSGVNLRLCRHRLPLNPLLAGIKHLNRLDQVMAAAELSSADFEGLMLDTNGSVIEGTRSNLFVGSAAGGWVTPRLDACGVEGTLRAYLLSQPGPLGEVTEGSVTMERLAGGDMVFVCNSVFGVIPVKQLATDDELIVFTIPPEISLLQTFLSDQLSLSWIS